MDACLRCQGESKVDAKGGGKDCVVVWGECNHSFHHCCMSLWIKQVLSLSQNYTHNEIFKINYHFWPVDLQRLREQFTFGKKGPFQWLNYDSELTFGLRTTDVPFASKNGQSKNLGNRSLPKLVASSQTKYIDTQKKTFDRVLHR